MAKKFTRQNGTVVTLLNPSEKGRKYADELRNGIGLTNDQHVKFDETGKPKKLTPAQKAFRSGYLAAQHDSAACYKAKQKK